MISFICIYNNKENNVKVPYLKVCYFYYYIIICMCCHESYEYIIIYNMSHLIISYLF